jgi:peroxiredoxin Q/BCP
MKFAIPLAVASTALLLAAPANAALKVGAKAPNFTTQGALGGKPFTFSLAAALKKGPVVVYFFPAAFTAGCTIEAHKFAEAAADFKKAGATLVGLTAGGIDKIDAFSKEECRSAFPVAAATPPMITGYDVSYAAGSKITSRTSYVIAPNGEVIYELTQNNPVGHVEGTLGAVRDWRAKHKG